jgi:hypothetical protein
MGIPILRSDFDHEMQRLFIGAMANAAIVQVDTLTIKNIEPVTSHRRRMLAADSIKVDVEVAGKDKTMATSIVKLLTADNINAELVNVGLPTWRKRLSLQNQIWCRLLPAVLQGRCA